MQFQIFCVVWAIFLLTLNGSSQTPVCHCNISNLFHSNNISILFHISLTIMWLVGSKSIRSNVTIKTTYFSRVFSQKMTSCALHYDVIYHPLPINSQYLKTWGVDSPGTGPWSTIPVCKEMQLWFIPPIQQLINQQYLNTWWHIQMSIIGEVHAPVILTLKPVSN